MTTQPLTETPLVKEVVINAPTNVVWEAITNKAKMKEWYFEMSDFKPEIGFEFQFEAQDEDCKDFVHHCKVTEVIPNEKLVHTWTYEGIKGLSHVTWELFDEGNSTRVKLTHTGLNTFDQNNPTFRRDNFDAGWTHILQTSLKSYLTPSA